MKKIILGVSLVWVFLFIPSWVTAESPSAQADSLYEQGGLENYQRSIDLYLKALKEDPESYEINWKLARGYRRYGEEAKRQGVRGWEDICAEYGKTGLKYGEKAKALNPQGVEGFYYYGLCVGIYSDGVSILTALKEGLKGKTQESFERAYELDKEYRMSGPTVALGRFWFVLPWPLHDKDKALRYLREARDLGPLGPEGKLFLAEALVDEDGEANRAEARDLLRKLAASGEPYFKSQAEELLADLD